MIFFKKDNFPYIELPAGLKGIPGIFAAPASVLKVVGLSGIVLCIQDNPKSITKLSKIKHPCLEVKVGKADTEYGIIGFMLFIIYDTHKKKKKYIYEVILKPNDYKSFKRYLILDQQKEWTILAVSDNRVLNTFKFDNVYKIGDAVKNIVINSVEHPCSDFEAAKNEYYINYNIEDLIDAT